MRIKQYGVFRTILMLAAGLGLALKVLTAAAAPDGSFLYAAPSPAGSGSCDSWENACTLQTAIAAAGQDDQIWTRMGVHKPTDTLDPMISFNLKNGVAIYGGFDGTESALEQRDPSANITILSGDIDDNDVTDPNGVVIDSVFIHGLNTFHVVDSSSVSDSALLDGFTVTAGYASYKGGGLYNGGGNLVLINVNFIGNVGDGLFGQGGAVYSEGGSLVLKNGAISGNSAAIGGGMYLTGYGSLALEGLVINNNFATFNGGGLVNIGDATLKDVVFRGNYLGVGQGGGMMTTGSPTLTNVTFRGNSGGGMITNSGSPTMTNVRFIQNTGGGMYNGSGDPILTNVLFSGNSSYNGGGFYTNGSPTLTNVTFSGNTALMGGGIYNQGGSPTLTNVILWGNTAITGTQIHNVGALPIISYSDIQGSGGSGAGWDPGLGTDGGGNLDADPDFVEVDCVGAHLGPNSSAIDAGNNLEVIASTDLDGNPRLVDIPSVPDTGNGTPPLVDMGAFEAQNLDVSPCYRAYFPLLFGIQFP